MALLTREQILAVQDIGTEIVPVPEWGGEVKVRGLNAKERVEIASTAMDADGKIDNEHALEMLVKLPLLCMVDESGAQLFTADDVERMQSKSSEALNRVFEAVLRLSALTDEVQAALKKD